MNRKSKTIDPNQALLDAVVAQRNDAQNALARTQAELAVANSRLADLQEQLAAALDKSAEVMMAPNGRSSLLGADGLPGGAGFAGGVSH